jgi:hypothetical protein
MTVLPQASGHAMSLSLGEGCQREVKVPSPLVGEGQDGGKRYRGFTPTRALPRQGGGKRLYDWGRERVYAGSVMRAH